VYETLFTPAPRSDCTWDPDGPPVRDHLRVHLYFPCTRVSDRYPGWVDHLANPKFDPVGPEAAVHDILEHLPDQRRGVADEFLAQGASILLRAEAGRFADPGSLAEVAGGAWDMLADSILGSLERTEDPDGLGWWGEPLRLHGDAELWLLRYLEMVHEVVTPRAAARWPHPTEGRRALAYAWDLAVPWMRAGYRVAARRYEALGVAGARDMFRRATAAFAREATDRSGPLCVQLNEITGAVTISRPGAAP
jgi:hypothetical protein